MLQIGHRADQTGTGERWDRISDRIGLHFPFPKWRGPNTLGRLMSRPVFAGRKGVFSMSILRHLAAALLLLPLFAASSWAQDYRVRSGDVLQIEVLEDATLNRTAIVLPDGNISLPLAGSVRAAGRSLAEVQADLAGRLAPKGFPTSKRFKPK
ncbi:MAG: hypothetical protein EON48_14780 [Acetobacteraceae bacterium]|nr:MAG: hypothetical protein EON48_14780 [Acetobacteraceae bacterium]